MFYYGTSFLQALQCYYARRLAQAIERGYDRTGAEYYWLYHELHERVGTIRQTVQFLEALPKFAEGPDALEKVLSHVVTYTTKWFPDSHFGTGPGEGSDSFYQDGNPYWVEFTDIFEHMDIDWDTAWGPGAYVELCEYVIRALRLYFHIREHRICAVDRSKFDEVMSPQMLLRNAG